MVENKRIDTEAVRPAKPGLLSLIDELNGEIILHLDDGRTVELHQYDHAVFKNEGMLYVENEDENDEWIDPMKIVSIEQH